MLTSGKISLYIEYIIIVTTFFINNSELASAFDTQYFFQMQIILPHMSLNAVWFGVKSRLSACLCVLFRILDVLTYFLFLDTDGCFQIILSNIKYQAYRVTLKVT